MLYPFIPEKTATMRDVSGCCCLGDCSFESRSRQVCISHFSKMFAFVYATHRDKAKNWMQSNKTVFVQCVRNGLYFTGSTNKRLHRNTYLTDG